MTDRATLAAEALAAWTIRALRTGEHSLSRQELPDLDLLTFMKAFSQAKDLPAISLALVGFQADEGELANLAKRSRAKCFAHFAANLHQAASWRNHRSTHPVIVAYAKGSVSGVNTLKHFAGPSSGALVTTLLEWAGNQKHFTQTPAQSRLLLEIASMVQKDDAFSFEQIRSYLEEWSSIGGTNAPRDALPALGLLKDPALFAEASLIRERLEKNAAMMATIRDRSAGQMQAVGKRLKKAAAKGRASARSALKAFEELQGIRRAPTTRALGRVTLEEALKVFKPIGQEPGPSPDDEDDDEDDRVPSVLNERQAERASADALLDDRTEELEHNATALSEGLRSALNDADAEGGDDAWECELDVGGDPQPFQGRLDRAFVTWIHHFCSESAWGGLIETNVSDLKRALDDFDRPGSLTLNPDQLLKIGGRQESIQGLLAGWDEDLPSLNQNAKFTELWEQFRSQRQKLLGSLDELAHFPMEWFAGNSAYRSTAEQYLQACGKLWDAVGRNYGAMVQKDPNWAKTTVEGLLALDVVQVRARQPDGRYSSKAVLLPTHPLHLWRYWRLSNILKGLGKNLSKADRDAVIKEASSPVQFLSVIFASPLPKSSDGRFGGAGQVLPIANDLHRLATFENLKNAYNGPDGQDTLVYAIERFAASHRLHVTPLRIALVNPPQPGALLLAILKLLDGRKKSLIDRLRVEVFGTTTQAARLRQAFLFDTRDREIIEEKVGAGRLELVIDRVPRPLDDILDALKNRPVHLVAVFDEAPVSVRRGGVGQRLPMSPFVVRRKVTFHKRWNQFRLEPTEGDPPFLEFITLLKHMEGNEGEGTPYAWPEAEGLRRSVDKVLTTEQFGASWFFLADRALPEEGEMQSQRLLRRREGQRQVLLASRDYSALARLMLPVFEEDTPNLLMPTARLQELLAEGAHLIGAGLLDLVKSREGRVVPGRVIGLMGTLLAARDYIRRYPDALLVSTDSQLARTWLRLGTQGERCDLLGVREHGGKLAIECVEVKTTKGAPRGTTDPEISTATGQLSATLGAVREGLGDTVKAERTRHFLAAPRNEMLKEVLVQGCMSRFAGQDERERWSQWFDRLFGSAPETPDLRGIIVDVALGSAEVTETQNVAVDGGVVRLEHLNETDVQRLLEPATSGASGGGGPTEPSPSPVTPPPSRQPAAAVAPSKAEPANVAKRATTPVVSPPAPATTSAPGPTPTPTPTPTPPANHEGGQEPDAQWPPSENSFGLIGQTAAATKLHNKAVLAREQHRRFSDTLFIGSAGVGKSSLARAVAKQLLADDPVFFSGSDLPQPSALIDKLRERGRVPAGRAQRHTVGKCLVFIDEVHALARPTATALLSAMDDARVATVGGTEYDFSNVVFIAATTDKGLLSDAFVSRMDLIPLAAYSLEELAGIIHFHGRKVFGGYGLPRNVCVEVAARTRCNPRRAVRALENDLLAEFYTRLSPERRKQPGAESAAAELMSQQEVAGYYDAQGIDLNGLDTLARQTLDYLRRHGPTAEDRLSRGLRISNRGDFVELIEYLSRLGLVTTTHTGRGLTSVGKAYILKPADLRDRI